MSAVIVMMQAAATVSPAARASAAPSDKSAEASDGPSKFEQLIAGGKTGKPARPDQRQSSATTPDEVSTPPGSQPTASDSAGTTEHHEPAKEEASTAAPAKAAAADGSAVLAWLQGGAVGAMPVPAAANPTTNVTTNAVPVSAAATLATATADGSLSAGLKSGAASANPVALGVRTTIDGPASSTVADDDADAGDGVPMFSFAGLKGGLAHDPAKTSLLTLDALQDLVPSARAGTGELPATVTAETSFAAMVAGNAGPAHPQAVSAQGDLDLQAALQTPLNTQSRELPQQIGERVQWLVSAGVQEARLQLHPRDLGSVTVQVRIEAGNASVFFGAEHPAARAALEAALPQLREQFASSGLQLAQTQVSAQSGNGSGGWSGADSRNGGGQGAGLGRGSHAGGDAGELSPVAVTARVVHLGLLDDYA